jgi:cytochrome P450
MNAPFVPPRPTVAEQSPGLAGFLEALRTNALRIWGADAYVQDVVQGRALGRPWILLNTPAAIQHVLVENVGGYWRTPASIRMLWPITGRGLLLTRGEEWRWQRRTTAPALAPRMMRLLVPIMARTIAAAVSQLRIAAAAGPVDLYAAMQALTLDVVARSIFSLDMGGFAATMSAELGRFAVRLARPTALDLVMPAHIPTPRDLARWWFRWRWVRLMDALVARRAAAPAADTPRDLFDLLRAARDPENGQGFTRRQLRDQVTTLIVAGHETTGLALFWALYLLANTPEVQARAAAEAEGADLSPDAALTTLPKLPFTAAVLNEALRLFPPAFTLVRQALAPDEAGGVAIPRGATVMIAPWVLHRHRRLWSDPDTFQPERFLPGAPTPPRFTYLPFGAGPRVCVGAQFALNEATLVLAAMLQAFRVEMASERAVLPIPVITTRPDHTPSFRLIPR